MYVLTITFITYFRFRQQRIIVYVDCHLITYFSIWNQCINVGDFHHHHLFQNLAINSYRLLTIENVPLVSLLDLQELNGDYCFRS